MSFPWGVRLNSRNALKHSTIMSLSICVVAMLETMNAAIAGQAKGATHAAEPHAVALEACADVLGPGLAEELAATDDGPAHPVDLGDSDEEPTEDVGPCEATHYVKPIPTDCLSIPPGCAVIWNAKRKDEGESPVCV